jgi:sulfoxide reductase heme-binding subunit YedZ
VSLAAIGPTAYWYLARGTGVVTLVLLTASVVLGILGPLRVAGDRWPRFAVDTVHRDVSLLVVVLLAVHIATSVLDGFAPISLTAAIIPFISPYRPIWLGLGAVAFDILLALVITSLLRRRFGYRRWRAVHWLAYASFPVAVLHGLGTGSDAKLWWSLLLTAGCVGAVVIATCVRVARSPAATPGLRGPAIALSLATPLALALFAVVGPLAHGWARRAGTPANLLPHTSRPRLVASSTPSAPARSGSSLRAFSAQLTGSFHQSQASGGDIVDLNMRLSGGQRGRLRVRLAGEPAGGGGLSMTGSQVDLLTPGMSSAMAGRINQLAGTEFIARVLNSSGALTLHARLDINPQADTVTGSLDASPAGGRP